MTAGMEKDLDITKPPLQNVSGNHSSAASDSGISDDVITTTEPKTSTTLVPTTTPDPTNTTNTTDNIPAATPRPTPPPTPFVYGAMSLLGPP